MCCQQKGRQRKAESNLKQIHGEDVEVSQGPTLGNHLSPIMTVAVEVDFISHKPAQGLEQS